MKSDTADPDVDGVRKAINRFVSSGGDLIVLRSSVEMLPAARSAERKA